MNRNSMSTMWPMIFLTISGNTLYASVYASSFSDVVVTYKPYIQPGDASALGETDQMIVAWQTDETTPNPTAYTVAFGQQEPFDHFVTPNGRVVNNYLAADPKLPVPEQATGPRTNYYAVLAALDFDSTYLYRVTGPGLPAEGFASSFPTRTLGGRFSFQVQGDDGAFIPDPLNPPLLADFEARIVHVMFNVTDYAKQIGLDLPRPHFAINTGDNVYNLGTENNYRDFWMPVWNSDTDSNAAGAPFIRHIPYYIVVGNHDVGGGPGITANLLAVDDSPAFSLNSGGGNALSYFNNYYFPLNGPLGVDREFIWNGDERRSGGMFFSYRGVDYTSPAAIEAFRASTMVDTGGGTKRQIDRMANYSFDYGNAHFVFLDANPYLFDARATIEASYLRPPYTFPEYPSILREWLINDLDSSHQMWKFVVYHQPALQSGELALRNNQMRRIAKLLEDHGVNMVLSGHQHHYQRMLPIRALPGVAEAPSSVSDPAVAIDTDFDGETQTVPDGVLYIVEGSGGDSEFDNGFGPPRGARISLDQEDGAIGTFTYDPPGLTFPQGPDSWLDTHLTSVQMSPFMPNPGSGPKITAKLKGKLFSFGQVVVNENLLTLYQISEPLSSTSSANEQHPYPYGSDYYGRPNNDPLPTTLVDPKTGQVVTPPADGTVALLDKFTITKSDLASRLKATLSARRASHHDRDIIYTVQIRNRSRFGLNGVQTVVTLPPGVTFVRNSSANFTVFGQDVVATVGRLGQGGGATVRVTAHMAPNTSVAAALRAIAMVRSATALPIVARVVATPSEGELDKPPIETD